MCDSRYIPAGIKRAVLVESGHRCAIPTCRASTIEIHHIEPYAKIKTHECSNLIALCPTCHTRVHSGDIDKKSIKLYKQKIQFLSDRYTKFEMNVLDYLKNNSKLIINGYIQVKNLLDNNLIRNANTIAFFTYDDGTNEVTEFVTVLTEQGKKFVQDWISTENTNLTY